jgi:DNA-binding NarL/FixJ family response regulator
MSIRILLADDQLLVRAGIRSLLEAQGDFAVSGEAADGEEATRLALGGEIDVAVLEAQLPRLRGVEVIQRVREAGARVRCLVLSNDCSQRSVEAAVRSGAAGYVVKGDTIHDLSRAIRTVARGESYLSSAVTKHVLRIVGRDACGDAGACLTQREREVLRLLAEDGSSKEIAEGLQISPKTVESHRANMMEKLGIHRVPDLVRFAIREGLVAP